MKHEQKEQVHPRPLTSKEIEEIIMNYPEQLRRELARLEITALGILAQDVAGRYEEINKSTDHE